MKEEASKFVFWTKTVDEVRRSIEKAQKQIDDDDQEAHFEPRAILSKIEDLKQSLKEEVARTNIFSQRQFFLKAEKMLLENEQKCQLLINSDFQVNSNSTPQKGSTMPRLNPADQDAGKDSDGEDDCLIGKFEEQTDIAQARSQRMEGVRGKMKSVHELFKEIAGLSEKRNESFDIIETNVSHAHDKINKKKKASCVDKTIMDIENDEEVLEEYDVIYVNNVTPFNVFQYPLRSKDMKFDSFFNLEEVSIKPQQGNLEFTYRANKLLDNFNKDDRGDIIFESKNIKNRTNYCVGYLDKPSKTLLLYPVESFYQMRRAFKLDTKECKLSTMERRSALGGAKEEVMNIPESKESDKMKKERDMKNRLENYLRSYNFQEEILNSEKFQNLAFHERQSRESSKLLNALLDPPKKVLDIKPLSKQNIISMLKL